MQCNSIHTMSDPNDRADQSPRETRTRRTKPSLYDIPAPSGKYRHFVEYIQRAIEIAGNGRDLGRMIGLTSGTRVTDWKLGRGGRPGISSILRMAKLTGDDPIDLLVMTGWDEEAELLIEWANDRAKAIGDVSNAAKFGAQRPKMQLLETRALLDAAIERLDSLGQK